MDISVATRRSKVVIPRTKNTCSTSNRTTTTLAIQDKDSISTTIKEVKAGKIKTMAADL